MDKYYNRSNAILPYYDIGIIYAGNKTSFLFALLPCFPTTNTRNYERCKDFILHFYNN